MYKEKAYSAKRLAYDIGTNTRYVSAVLNVRFGMNYTSFVNRYRVSEAMQILKDDRYRGMTMEDVSSMVGFANRQSFYAASTASKASLQDSISCRLNRSLRK